jgi:foldase protein PrsA
MYRAAPPDIRHAARPSRSASRRPLLGVVGALALAAGLMACGGVRPDHVAPQAGVTPDQLGGPANPEAIVVRVGPYSIAGATLNRFVRAELRSEPSSEQLVPPDFSACVAHLEAESAAIGERPRGPSQLRRECQTRYRAVAQAVLDRLISYEWLIGGARELGVPIGDREAKVSLDRYRHEDFPSGAQFRRFLAGRTLADIMLETRAKLAPAAVRRAIKDRVRPMTQAQIMSYYALHRFQYLLAAERDLKIARTATEAAAVKVRAEIASGRSFASVVGRLSVRQPVNSNEGSVLELQPHTYGEPNLNQAIFTAAPGVLVGPVRTWFGYFVFEVTRIRFERERPLAQVQAAIRRRLARPLQEQALAGFVKQWRTRWTARTDCSPGYVVPECRQFRGSPAPSPEGLSPLN